MIQKINKSKNLTIRNFRITANDDKIYNTKHYNLNTILAKAFNGEL
jgi:hypothetical protein